MIIITIYIKQHCLAKTIDFRDIIPVGEFPGNASLIPAGGRSGGLRYF